MSALAALPDHVLGFLAERHHAALTTLRRDGSPHVTPVGFTVDPPAGLARVITDGGSVKVANVRRDPRVTLCSLDGRRWVTLGGVARVSDDQGEVAEAVARYAVRYRQPRVNPTRVVLLIEVQRVLGARWPAD